MRQIIITASKRFTTRETTNKTINTILLHVSSSSSIVGHMVTDTADGIHT